MISELRVSTESHGKRGGRVSVGLNDFVRVLMVDNSLAKRNIVHPQKPSDFLTSARKSLFVFSHNGKILRWVGSTLAVSRQASGICAIWEAGLARSTDVRGCLKD